LAAGIFKRPQLCPEGIFDLPCVDFSQVVHGAKDPMCRDGRVLRGEIALSSATSRSRKVADASAPRIGFAGCETTLEPRPGML
jgi:hypothetical protein